jgi:hypothetical protein
MNPRAHSLLLDQGHSGWPSPNLKKVFSTAQNYKVKFDKGIISLWEGYHLDEFKVCLSMRIFPYLSLNLLPNPCNPRNVCGSTIGWYYNLFTPIFTFQLAWTLPLIQKYKFKHGNWNQFVRPIDEEVMRNYVARHSDSPRFGLVWLGICV